MGISLLLGFLLAAAPPVPSDCRVDEVHDLGHKLHLSLFFVDTHCAGEPVAYLCTDTRCLKDPCGGADTEAPQFLAVGSPSRSSRGGHAKKGSSHSSGRASHSGRSAKSKSHAEPGATLGEVPALFLRGPSHALQVVTLTVSSGMPGCRPVKGLDEVLVKATNERVKIGETLGRSGERDALSGKSLVLTRGLYAGGDEQGAPSHGYLRIRAKLSGAKLKYTSASRISQDTARFGRH